MNILIFIGSILLILWYLNYKRKQTEELEKKVKSGISGAFEDAQRGIDEAFDRFYDDDDDFPELPKPMPRSQKRRVSR